MPPTPKKRHRKAAQVSSSSLKAVRQTSFNTFRVPASDAYNYHWPVLPHALSEQLLERMRQELDGGGPDKPAPSKSSASSGSNKSSAPSGSSKSSAAATAGLTVGAGAVARRLQGSAAAGAQLPFRLILVCRDTEPLHAISHLPALCYARSVPICMLGRPANPAALGRAVGAKRALAIGFSAAPPAGAGAAALADALAEHAVQPALPWLRALLRPDESVEGGESFIAL